MPLWVLRGVLSCNADKPAKKSPKLELGYSTGTTEVKLSRKTMLCIVHKTFCISYFRVSRERCMEFRRNRALYPNLNGLTATVGI